MVGAGGIPNGNGRNVPGTSISCLAARPLAADGGELDYAAISAPP